MTTIEFSTHSPVTLDVYDSAGRHTGLTAAGTVVADIPGSAYETIGENSFATLPPPAPGETYRIAIAAIATGTFEMKVKEYGGGTADELAAYIAVPLASASTTAELDFGGFGGDMGLKMDEDGNGVAETTMEPTAILASPSSTADITPPEMVLPTIPAEAPLNGTATLVFGATDAESGVATTSAALNGIPTVSGETVAFTVPGPNVFTLAAVDRAGNPRTAKVDFTVVVPAPAPPPEPPPAPAPATATAMLAADADTYLSHRHKNENYGAAAALRVGGNDDARTLVHFGLAGLRNTIDVAKIVSAKLMFAPVVATGTAKNGGRAGSTAAAAARAVAAAALSLSPVYIPWSERGATWNGPEGANMNNNKADCGKQPVWPEAPPAQAKTRGAATADGGILFDVTDDLRKLYAGALPDYGWMVMADGKRPLPLAAFASREAPSDAPQLVVTYTVSQ